ncbi:MAG: Bax inhibitor-1 family protein [Shewanella sp.]
MTDSDNSVFARSSTDQPTIGAGAYNLIIGLTLIWGFAVNYWMVTHINPDDLNRIHPWIFLAGYFASCFLGIYLFHKSAHPVVSFVGYNLVVVPFGLVINMVVVRYDPQMVTEAIRLTGLVTLGMMALGTLFPQFFRKIAGALGIALLLVIIVELIEIIAFNTHHGFIDWLVVLIFCAYIGYDWGRANQIPKTIDNAIDSAAALYMDIINLFLRTLRIVGRK